MPSPICFVSLTRLRIRSIFFLPAFALHAQRTQSQVQHATGFLRGGLLPDHDWTFWTMTVWNTQADMRAYMVSGAHMKAMPKLLNWCDEASVTHWEQESETLPTWEEADQRMRSSGRASKVRHPSKHHADLTYRAPRTNRAVTITRA